MVCDTRLKSGQTISQRAAEVRRVVDVVSVALASGRVKPRIGVQGAIAFDGVSEVDRDGVTDACIFRRIMATGSSLAKAAIARAEQMSGRSVNRQAVAQGHHSHDGGSTWHKH